MRICEPVTLADNHFSKHGTMFTDVFVSYQTLINGTKTIIIISYINLNYGFYRNCKFGMISFVREKKTTYNM